MIQYNRQIFEQYKNAEGFRTSETNAPKYMLDLVGWIQRRQLIAKTYIELLSELNYQFEYIDCAEVGKGPYDTIVKEFGTTLITPYIEGIKDIRQDRILEGTFTVNQGRPILTPSNTKEELILPPNFIKTYMTQNPYDIANIANWDRLHNSHEVGIIVGIYGNTYDKDIETKRKMLEELAKKLDSHHKEIYTEYGDEYFYIVGSKPKVKKISR